jgi:outer membrane PBP1 activator LpoA protein
MARVAPRAAPKASVSNATASTGPLSNAETSSAVVSSGPTSSPTASKAQRDTGVVDDESTLIVRAVRALRHEGDPARAQALAEQSLARFPHGAQIEEAMALVMESAFARGDAAGAQRAASAYLDRFRSGRFADRAQRILASPAR